VVGRVTIAPLLLRVELLRDVTRYVALEELELSKAKVGKFKPAPVAVIVVGRVVSTKQLQGNVKVILSFNAYSAFNLAVIPAAPKSAKVTCRAAVVAAAPTAAAYCVDTVPRVVTTTPPARATPAEAATMAPTVRATRFF